MLKYSGCSAALIILDKKIKRKFSLSSGIQNILDIKICIPTLNLFTLMSYVAPLLIHTVVHRQYSLLEFGLKPRRF